MMGWDICALPVVETLSTIAVEAIAFVTATVALIVMMVNVAHDGLPTTNQMTIRFVVVVLLCVDIAITTGVMLVGLTCIVM